MDRFTLLVERAAGLLLVLVMTLTVATVALRGLVGVSIPDWYMLACFAQAAAILWGFAPATYRNSHIAVDALWEAVGPAWKRRLDLFAAWIVFLSLATLAWALAQKVGGDALGNAEATSELRLPIWPFNALAASGVGLAALLGGIRLWRLHADRRPVAEQYAYAATPPAPGAD
jgi:TRAP-type C4-dicarboxylate transport system permease small subunit